MGEEAMRVRGPSRWGDSGTYPPCDIDKVRARGETWPVDPEMREAFDRLSADLRGEIRSSAAEGRVYVAGSIQASAAETRAYLDERLQTSTAEMRRHFDMVGESLRGDIRGVAELVALSDQGSKRRDDEQAGRTDGLEKRVLRLEVRVLSLEDNRKPRRPRRRP
jgi:hypothetical protein